MAITHTDRLGLTLIGDPELVTPDVLREANDDDNTILDDLALYSEGPIGSRPNSTPSNPGLAGRFYKSTNENPQVLYFDHGTGWVPVARSNGALTTHATTHASAGTDPLYKAGARSPGTTDGGGRISDTVTHGLGATPSAVLVQLHAQDVMHYTANVTALSSTTFSVDFATTVAGFSVSYRWVALR